MKKILYVFIVIFLLSFFVPFSIYPQIPAPSWVNDALVTDIDYTNVTTSFSASWESIDWNKTSGESDIGYDYYLKKDVGNDYSTVQDGSIETTLPQVPVSYVTEQLTPAITEGLYRIEVQSKRSVLAGGWQYSEIAYSDGFIVNTTPPSASMDTLSNQQTTTSFSVSWSGSDPVSGDVSSGIASYDVQVRDGEIGSWTTWQSGVSQTQATFNGEWRHTYYFRVRARDNAGNLSAYSSSVSTSADTIAPQASIQFLSSIQTSTSFLVRWDGTDNESGISCYDVQVKTGNGAWTNFLLHTTVTQALFTGNNGQSYTFRIRAVDVAGNTGSYSAGSQTTVQASGVSMSITASPSSITFGEGEENKQITLDIGVSGPGSITLTEIRESRYNSETGTESFPPEPLSGNISSGSTYALTKTITLTSSQRSSILTTSTRAFNLTLEVQGIDSFSNIVTASVTISVEVTQLPPSSLVINDVQIIIPQSPYFVGDLVENATITIDATGSGVVEGQVLVDDETDWSDTPGFNVTINNTTSFVIDGQIPTNAPGEHTIKVQITNPVNFEKVITYTVSDQTPPFPPQSLVLVEDVAELTDLNGTAQATTVTGPTGYIEYNFTGTATMKLLSLNNAEVQEVIVTNLIVRYANDDPTKAKIRGGTVEKEIEDGYITTFHDGLFRVKRVFFEGQVSPPTDFIRVDAKLYWDKINMELFTIGGFVVRGGGVEAKSVNI